MRTMSHLAVAAMLAALTLAAAAQQRPIAYPAKGQSETRQNKDEAECQTWARNKTGVDPAAAAPPTQETGPATGGGERMRGAARGAVGGAAIGAIAGDTGKGAGVGAVAGTMAGGHRARQNQQSRNAASQQAQSEQAGAYNRAWSACMSGRGYSMS